MKKIMKISPADIEKKSFEIITEELGDRQLDPEKAPVIKRVIHTTADFEYADSLYFSPGVMEKAKSALSEGALIVTDTKMAMAGINKKVVTRLGGRVECFIADDDVAKAAKESGSTRAAASVDKAERLCREEGLKLIYAVGNAPTALIRLRELMDESRISPELIVGVPVGFVNVIQAKELIIESGCRCIVARGRKGGSNVAACIINALLYEIDKSRGENSISQNDIDKKILV